MEVVIHNLLIKFHPKEFLKTFLLPAVGLRIISLARITVTAVPHFRHLLDLMEDQTITVDPVTMAAEIMVTEAVHPTAAVNLADLITVDLTEVVHPTVAAVNLAVLTVHLMEVVHQTVAAANLAVLTVDLMEVVHPTVAAVNLAEALTLPVANLVDLTAEAPNLEVHPTQAAEAPNLEVHPTQAAAEAPNLEVHLPQAAAAPNLEVDTADRMAAAVAPNLEVHPTQAAAEAPNLEDLVDRMAAAVVPNMEVHPTLEAAEAVEAPNLEVDIPDPMEEAEEAAEVLRAAAVLKAASEAPVDLTQSMIYLPSHCLDQLVLNQLKHNQLQHPLQKFQPGRLLSLFLDLSLSLH